MEGLVGLPLFFENDIHLSCAMVADCIPLLVIFLFNF